MLYFFEAGRLSDPIPLPSPYRSRLNRLFQHKRQPDGQVIKTAENSPFLFSLTCSIAQFSKRPDHFTAEYIFATAFTNHYDEFARYFPEFGRLKALSRMMILVRFLKGIRKQNDANQKRLQKILNNPDHEIWNKGRAESLINSFTAIWKKHILKSEVDRLSREKDGAGLFLTKQSPEVRAECQKIFETRKANYIDQNGWFSRFDQTCPKLEDVIEKEAPSVIVRLQKENRPKFEANARKKYGRKLQDCWPGSYSVYINLYLKGNAVPLAFALAVAEKNREHEIQFQSLKKELGIALSDNECLSVLLGEEKIAVMVVKQIRRNPKSALIKAWSTQEKTIRDQLTAQIEKCKRLCESLKALKLGKESEEKNIDGICSWVPAVSDQNVSGNRYRFVYGGVSLNPHVQIYKGNDPRAQAIARRVTQDQQVARVSATNLAAQRERLANNLRAANLRSSNLAQQYRLYEQAQFFNRRGDGSSSGRTGGVGHGSSTSTPAPAPPGGGSGSGDGGDDGGNGKGPGGWTVKARLKAAKLPTEGKIRFVPPDNYKPTVPLPKAYDGIGYEDKFGNIWKKGPSRTFGQPFEWDVQLSKTGQLHFKWLKENLSHLNVSLDGRITHLTK